MSLTAGSADTGAPASTCISYGLTLTISLGNPTQLGAIFWIWRVEIFQNKDL